ncbi:MAG: outer membrane protein OmpA-like peptidoglycan-associated protein [Saprospiraceae bacterium]|jgi:outer membrane protein OmpA-like peptidoglycan-associated protein
MTLQRLLTICFCFLCFALSAQSAKMYKKLGDTYYSTGKYREALDAFQRYHEVKPEDLIVKQKIGICHYFTNNIPEARRFLTYVIENNKKPEADVYFFLGRTYHAENDFKKAIAQYKGFLRNIEQENINRPLVKDAIRRCAYGLRISGGKTPVIVENLGEKVNSIGDDFRPILSPNHDNKLYFSSARAGNLGGLRTNKGYEDAELGKYSTDMFSTTVINGEWTATQPMSYLLNSPRHDVLLDFSERGDQMFFFKGYTGFSGDMLVDTFKRIEERSLFAPEFQGDIQMWKGDVGPHFYNDSILLFASTRAGGYGGLDIYISKKSNGEWQVAKNLGPRINSAYDENTPYLAKDGRTLYFSSNRPDLSMGGYDILQSFFTDRTEKWTPPKNLKMPINSSGDDKDFRLSNDGLKAFFSSSRKDGLGQNDLFVAYFREKQKETFRNPEVTLFTDILDLRQKREAAKLLAQQQGTGENTEGEEPAFTTEEITTYDIEPLYYEEDGNVITIKNQPKLKQLAKLAAEYPQLIFLLSAHSDGADPVKFDLYFSIKKAEKAAEYLINQGSVAPERIILKGYGSAFPIAKNEVNGIENVLGRRFNRRIDVNIENTDGLPILMNIIDPDVSKQMKTMTAKLIKNGTKGLSYKVQIAAITQMYKGDLIFKYPNAMVESTGDKNLYRYSVGMYKTFSSANQLREDLNKQGVGDAFVVPYMNGVRLTENQMLMYGETYPDLLKLVKTEEVED